MLSCAMVAVAGSKYQAHQKKKEEFTFIRVDFQIIFAADSEFILAMKR